MNHSKSLRSLEPKPRHFFTSFHSPIRRLGHAMASKVPKASVLLTWNFQRLETLQKEHFPIQLDHYENVCLEFAFIIQNLFVWLWSFNNFEHKIFMKLSSWKWCEFLSLWSITCVQFTAFCNDYPSVWAIRHGSIPSLWSNHWMLV